jgi:hypothetical protein
MEHRQLALKSSWKIHNNDRRTDLQRNSTQKTETRQPSFGHVFCSYTGANSVDLHDQVVYTCFMTEKSFKHIADNLDPEVKWVKPLIVVYPYVDREILQTLSDKYSELNHYNNYIKHAETALIIAINKSEESKLQKEIEPEFKVVPGSHYRDIKIKRASQPSTSDLFQENDIVRLKLLVAALVFFSVMFFSR